MKQLSTICGAVKHAQYLEHRCNRGNHGDCCGLINQLMDIFDAVQDMGERMENRLREYRDFCDDLQERMAEVRKRN